MELQKKGIVQFLTTNKTQHLYLVDDASPFGQEINPLSVQLLRQWLRAPGGGGISNSISPLDKTIEVARQLLKSYMDNIGKIDWKKDGTLQTLALSASAADPKSEIKLADWYLDEGSGIVIFNPNTTQSKPKLPHFWIRKFKKTGQVQEIETECRDSEFKNEEIKGTIDKEEQTAKTEFSGYLLVVQAPGVSRDEVNFHLDAKNNLRFTVSLPTFLGADDEVRERGTCAAGECELIATIPPECSSTPETWIISPTKTEVREQKKPWTGVLTIFFPKTLRRDIDT